MRIKKKKISGKIINECISPLQSKFSRNILYFTVSYFYYLYIFSEKVVSNKSIYYLSLSFLMILHVKKSLIRSLWAEFYPTFICWLGKTLSSLSPGSDLLSNTFERTPPQQQSNPGSKCFKCPTNKNRVVIKLCSQLFE